MTVQWKEKKRRFSKEPRCKVIVKNNRIKRERNEKDFEIISLHKEIIKLSNIQLSAIKVYFKIKLDRKLTLAASY